ncbi:MAG: cell division topological specificity factor MinE [Eubacteriales bacterium]|jgi:cell division topological specificity factor|nr:cell division topological specificity factor MinE [Eubacteriales bacterium]NCC81152.1 cell division topological specificity factor MinE [Clostridia bacterium]
MGFFDFFSKNKKNTGSKNIAKDRLKLVLVHDRASMSPEVMEALRKELIQVISKYVDVDSNNIEVELNDNNNQATLVANIPINQIKRSRNV